MLTLTLRSASSQACSSASVMSGSAATRARRASSCGASFGLGPPPDQSLVNIGVLIVCSSPGSAQNANTSLFSQAGTKQGPVTLTLKDALALAEKNDPALLAATSDAVSE